MAVGFGWLLLESPLAHALPQVTWNSLPTSYLKSATPATVFFKIMEWKHHSLNLAWRIWPINTRPREPSPQRQNTPHLMIVKANWIAKTEFKLLWRHEPVAKSPPMTREDLQSPRLYMPPLLEVHTPHIFVATPMDECSRFLDTVSACKFS
jgi:hypothetical protein